MIHGCSISSLTIHGVLLLTLLSVVKRLLMSRHMPIKCLINQHLVANNTK
uniref:Uncharacterized protein n=1 Tax=Rhizophora mucronata TaxID=61149 RepID=A0A2P2Q115_RHIMU